MLIIKVSIATTRRQDLEMDFELLWVELASSPSNTLLSVFYNLPASRSMHYSSCKTVLSPYSTPSQLYLVEIST